MKDRATGKVLLQGRLENGLYKLFSSGRSRWHSANKIQAYLVSKSSLDFWHCRLGHPSLKVVHGVIKTLNVLVKINKNCSVCSSCQEGKSHKQPFPVLSSLSIHPLDLIHYDVWGHVPYLASNKFRYYIFLVMTVQNSLCIILCYLKVKFTLSSCVLSHKWKIILNARSK